MELTEQHDDEFTIVWSVDQFRAVFHVYWIVSSECHHADGTIDRRPWYHRDGAADGMDLVTETSQATVYAGGGIKWDGCSEVTFEDHLHLCGRGCWESHLSIMAYLWPRAGELMRASAVEDGDTSHLADDFQPLR